MMKNSLISVAAVAALSSFVFAGGDIDPIEPYTPDVETSTSLEGNAYIGLGAALVSTSDSTVGASFFAQTAGQDRLGNATLLAGYKFNSYVGVEGRYSTTVYESDFLNMDSWSLFLKPQFPMGDDLNAYALLGYGGVTMGAEGVNTVDVDGAGFQWGIGLDYAVTEKVSVFFDYTSLASSVDGVYYNGAKQADADALTLGVTYAL